jgi:hypothetical protein
MCDVCGAGNGLIYCENSDQWVCEDCWSGPPADQCIECTSDPYDPDYEDGEDNHA